MEIPVRKASKAITLVSPTLEPHMKLFAKGKVKVIPNGVHVPKEYMTNSGNDVIQIISIGRVVKQKGIQHAINAIAYLPSEIQDKVRLNVVGDGDYLDALEKLTAQKNLQNVVTFHGKLIGKPLQDIYQQSQIHLMPTTSHEGLPLTILEGMAFGLATIASKIGGIPSVITDGVNGFLIKPGNVQELIKKLESLIEKPQTISDIGEAARTSVIKQYSKEIMVEKTLKVLNSVV